MLSDYIYLIFIIVTRLYILGFLDRDTSELNKYVKGQPSSELKINDICHLSIKLILQGRFFL